jgi:hypothetical protein
MEQLVILLIIGAISLINWLLQKSAEHKQRRRGGALPTPTTRDVELPPWEEPTPTPRDTGGFSQEEQMRRFFEALGLPPPEQADHEPVITPSFETEPPPLPAPVPTPRVSKKPRIPPVVFQESPAPEPAKPTLRESREMRELAEAFAANQRDAASTTGTQAVFRNLLSNPHAARQAIILQEILNPPRALRPYSA